jgi:rhodanese-related sulfurtransferase
VRPKLIGASAAAALGIGLAILWSPTSGLRAQALENKADRAVASGDVQVSPAELATLMHNRQLNLAIFDLRDEPAFNRFHLIDAKRPAGLSEIRALPDKTVKMLVADDDELALRAYRALARLGAKQVYVLAGGIPAWLALFAPPSTTAAILAGALGDRHPASFPDIEHALLPKFQAKVKLGAGPKKGPGGCGG